MYKGIEWLKEEIGELPCVDTVFNSDGSSYIDSAVPVMAVFDLIDQLDEPEVLSHKWIHENKEMYLINDTSENAVPDYKLQNLLVPKQELPVIPKYVAEYVELAKSDVTLMRVLEIANRRNELPKWRKEYDWISANDETFARAWLDGYEVEEPLYYALIKGHELASNPIKYWAKHKDDSEDLFITYRHKDDNSTIVKNTKNRWNELGINDSNAHFVRVKRNN